MFCFRLNDYKESPQRKHSLDIISFYLETLCLTNVCVLTNLLIFSGLLRRQMAAQVQISFQALLCHQASSDPGQDSEIHPIPLRRHRTRAASVGHRNPSRQRRETAVRELSMHRRRNNSRGHRHPHLQEVLGCQQRPSKHIGHHEFQPWRKL